MDKPRIIEVEKYTIDVKDALIRLENIMTKVGCDYDIKLELFDDKKAESYKIKKDGDTILLAGSDNRGLTYAIDELVGMIVLLGKEAFEFDEEKYKSCDYPIRGVCKFIVNTHDTTWWMSVEYWREYLSLLSESRFNRLTLILGFDTAYFSPPYPFLFDIEDFENVKVASRYAVDKNKYLHSLKKIGDICHEYNIEFSLAIWQQIPWQKGQNKMVSGLEDVESLREYCHRGLKKLILTCPEIDVLQLRVNHESGVGTQESAEDYWLEQIKAVKEAICDGEDIKLELRIKGMTNKMLSYAKELDLDVSISTKYSCEHMSLPYHMTKMRKEELDRIENLNHSRRYSYSNLLEKPYDEKLIYRLWSSGSNDLFAWSDPDYVKRFIKSLELGDANGYEIMAPLSYRGGHQFDCDVNWELYKDKKLVMDEIDDMKYKGFYMLFGHAGYSLDSADDAYKKYMLEIGDIDGNLSKAYIAASKIMPFITSFHFTEHPQLWYWPEMMTGGALFKENNHHPVFKDRKDTYQNSMPLDEGLFYSINEYVLDSAVGNCDGRYTPYQICAWLDDFINEAEKHIKLYEREKDKNSKKERIAKDILMLTYLARYHKYKTCAAIGLSWYEQLTEPCYLKDAYEMMKKAFRAWRELSALGNKTYYHNLIFATGQNCMRRGNWSDYIIEIERDLDKLHKLVDKYKEEKAEKIYQMANIDKVIWSDNLPKKQKKFTELRVELETENIEQDIYLCYKHTNQLEPKIKRVKMNKEEDNKYTTTLEKDIFDPKWDLIVYFTTSDIKGDAIIYPGIYNSNQSMPYKIIQVN